jgi:hypothetical protein
LARNIVLRRAAATRDAILLVGLDRRIGTAHLLYGCGKPAAQFDGITRIAGIKIRQANCSGELSREGRCGHEYRNGGERG